MNRLTGNILAIEHNEHMSLVDVAVGEDVFTATVLETPDTAAYLKVGTPVALLFKETEVSIAKNLSGLLTLRNRFQVTVTAIERGKIMSAVKLDYRGQAITSVVTTRGIDRIGLATGDQAEGLVKANEMVIAHDP